MLGKETNKEKKQKALKKIITVDIESDSKWKLTNTSR